MLTLPKDYLELPKDYLKLLQKDVTVEEIFEIGSDKYENKCKDKTYLCIKLITNKNTFDVIVFYRTTEGKHGANIALNCTLALDVPSIVNTNNGATYFYPHNKRLSLSKAFNIVHIHSVD